MVEPVARPMVVSPSRSSTRTGSPVSSLYVRVNTPQMLLRADDLRTRARFELARHAREILVADAQRNEDALGAYGQPVGRALQKAELAAADLGQRQRASVRPRPFRLARVRQEQSDDFAVGDALDRERTVDHFNGCSRQPQLRIAVAGLDLFLDT